MQRETAACRDRRKPMIAISPFRKILGLISAAVTGMTLTAGVSGISQAAAQTTYPSKAVRVLTGYPPGGPTDLIGRVLTDHLTAAMGQPFYVEGKPGAAGNVAGAILAASPPDGYNLYIVG